ncbi:uncharacterized protein LOC115919285 [Strongylocentrotus purpuratus]|uniref:Uncharacterized protein n=1 Tax=Strongylocentrotus purpuratus TaxID=7668 RepID=A0A7M7MYR3_STRPU|nr:uncharacterized protein LOC115919285 [Strongylocentrotus purpuratus]
MRVLPIIFVVAFGTSCLWLDTAFACRIKSCGDCRRCGSTQPGCLSCLRGLASSGKRSSPDFLWPSYGSLSRPHPQNDFLTRHGDMDYGKDVESQDAGLEMIASALRKIQTQDIE